MIKQFTLSFTSGNWHLVSMLQLFSNTQHVESMEDVRTDCLLHADIDEKTKAKNSIPTPSRWITPSSDFAAIAMRSMAAVRWISLFLKFTCFPPKANPSIFQWLHLYALICRQFLRLAKQFPCDQSAETVVEASM